MNAAGLIRRDDDSEAVPGEAVAEANEGAEKRAPENGEHDRVGDSPKEVPAEAGEQVEVPVAPERLGQSDAGLVGDVGACRPERPEPEVGDRTEEEAGDG